LHRRCADVCVFLTLLCIVFVSNTFESRGMTIDEGSCPLGYEAVSIGDHA